MKPIRLTATFYYALIPILFVLYTTVAWIAYDSLTIAIVGASFIISIALIFSAWIWNRESSARVFKIKAGNHYPSGWNFQLPTEGVRYLKAYFVVYNDFLYHVRDSDNQDMLTQISKVGGHCWGYDPHVNSARVGVNHESQSGTRTFFSYVYVAGTRRLDPHTEREPILYREIYDSAYPREYYTIIKADEERDMITIELYDALSGTLLGHVNEYSVGIKDFDKFGYIEHPYIGGEVPLSQDCSMKWQLTKISQSIPQI